MGFDKNKFKIKRDYIAKGNARSGNKIKEVTFGVAHDTGNPGSTAQNNRDYFNNHQPSASAHTFIDDEEILEIVPLDEKAWHVRYNVTKDNQMYGNDANDEAIGAELCYGSNIDFNKAYEKYVWYWAYLCDKFSLNPETDIVAHATLDPGRRTDPHNALNKYGKSFDGFIKDVVKELNAKDKKEDKPKTSTYKGDSIVDYLNSIGVNSSYSNRAKLAKQYDIKNYKGTAAQNLELLNKMRKGSKPKAEKKNWKLPNTKSIVDFMNANGMNASFSNRAKLARNYGISGYRGTASQNLTLLKKIRGF